MKKHLLFLMTWACCAMLCVSLTSCPGPDPEPDPDPTPTPNPAVSVSDFGGTRITAMGPYAFSYDSQGRFISASYSGEDEGYRIDYKNGLIYGDDNMGYIKFNNDGYISQVSYSWDEIDEDGFYDVGFDIYTYTYDNQGNIVKYEDKLAGTRTDLLNGGETRKYYDNRTVSFIWSNNNITKIIEKGEWDDEEGYGVYDDTYYLTYSDVNNPYRQYLYSFIGYIDVNDYRFVLGLYGKGPAKFPISIKHEYKGTSFIINFVYTLNENGTISSETFDYDKYHYSYRSIGESRAAFAEVEQPFKVSDREAKPSHHKRHKRHLRSIN